jgi:acetyl-CoA carboxylase biotin carboxylase subunit
VREAGLVFVGPSPEAMALVGDKIAARELAARTGLPLVPGSGEPLSSLEDVRAAARDVGFPALIKPAAGGGGKGMRVVRSDADLERALAASRDEARKAFGDDRVFLERYVADPRHVEFQVMADRFGNAIHLGERECSIQRRHQKLLEESPSPALDPGLRREMGETAVRAMRAAGYNNAGTVEFLLDKAGRFYFLEVNARLQVEHPVTELVTGVDLVRQQILIASGAPLALRQEDVAQRGHAIECRIYAEDAKTGFLPSAGRIVLLREPKGPGVRFDSGIAEGFEVPVYYDPILAKLIVWAEDRETARLRMAAALEDCVILGIHTTAGFLRDVVDHPEFRTGRATTSFIGKHFASWGTGEGEEDRKRLALAAAAFEALSPGRTAGGRAAVGKKKDAVSPWATLGRWRAGGDA